MGNFIKHGMDSLTGKGRLRKQHQESIEQAHRAEAELQAKLRLQLQNTLAKLAGQRHSAEVLKQQTLAAFQIASQRIKDNLQLIKAGLQACRTGHIEIIEALLKRSVSLRFSFFDLDPLHIAAEHNQAEVVKRLCRDGANVNKRNPHQLDALSLAEQQGNREVVDALNAIRVQCDALWDAVDAEDMSGIETALKNGASINATDERGYNVFQIAVMNNQKIDILTQLIKGGAHLKQIVYIPEGLNKIGSAGLRFKILPQDGHCLYRAVGIYCQEEPAALRNKVAHAIENNRAEYEPLINGLQNNTGGNFASYVQGIRGDAWADELEISVLMKILNRPILVVGPLGEIRNPVVEALTGEPIWVGYNGADHYDALIIQGELSGSEILRRLKQNSPNPNAVPVKVKKSTLELADWHADPAVKTLILETLAAEQSPCIVEEALDAALTFQGPLWKDDYGWLAPQYYKTIRSVVVPVEQQNRLFALARTSTGIHCHHYDFKAGAWVENSSGPKWADRAGYFAPEYYSTLQLQKMVVKGEHQLFLMVRQAAGLELWQYAPRSGVWQSLAQGPALSDKAGWSRHPYYSSIQSLVMNTSDGQDKLFVLARQMSGIILWSYDPNTHQWRQHPEGPTWSDSLGWSLLPYYSTIQAQVIKTEDGKNKLFLIARQSIGIVVWSYSPDSSQWSRHPDGPSWSDSYGWKEPAYYSTIVSQVVQVNGQQQLFCLTRSMTGIDLWSYNPNTQKWQQQAYGPRWSDKAGWMMPHYYSTIQTSVIPGYPGTELLLLFGRSSAGLEAHAYNPGTGAWIEVPLPAFLSDEAGWIAEHYHSTIQIHCTKIKHLNTLLVLARASSGLQCRAYSLNLKLLTEPSPPLLTVEEERLENQKAMNFLNGIEMATHHLFNAAENGFLVGVQSSLANGADISATDADGYDVLQRAILNKADLGVVKELLQAGADVHYRGNIQNKNALELCASEHRVELQDFLAAELELENPMKGVWETLKEDKNLFYGPPWSDKTGWACEQYGATVRTEIISNGDQDEILVLGRSASGIELHHYDPVTSVWSVNFNGPRWSDADHWSQPPYYTTIKTKSIGKTLFVIGRGAEALHCWSYDTVSRQWREHPNGPRWSDAANWDKREYYSTLRVEAMADASGEICLWVLSRGSRAVHLHSYNPVTQVWTEHPNGPKWGDPVNWHLPKYYETIRTEVIEGGLFVLSRGQSFIHLRSYNPKTGLWTEHPNGPQWSDETGWCVPHYYSSIRVASLNLEGQNHLILLARSAAGIECHSYNPANSGWARLPDGPRWSDKGFWFEPQYSATLQLCSSNHQSLILSARSSAGVYVYRFQHNRWEQFLLGPALSDKCEWSKPAYYSSIQVHEVALKAKTRVLISARSKQGIYFYPAELDIAAQFKASYQCYFNRAQAFLDKHKSGIAKCQAIMAYYRLLSQYNPYALYTWPGMLVMAKLLTAMQGGKPALAAANEAMLMRAQTFFKRTLAAHRALNEVGVEHWSILQTEAEFSDTDWSHVIGSTSLKQEAEKLAIEYAVAKSDDEVSSEIYRRYAEVWVKAIEGYLKSFAIQVWQFNGSEMDWVAETTQWIVRQQMISPSLFREYYKQIYPQQLQMAAWIAKDASESGIIQLGGKSSLYHGLQAWQLSQAAVQQGIQQKEAEHFARIDEINIYIQNLYAADAEVLQQYNKAYWDLRNGLIETLNRLEADFERAKSHLERRFIRNLAGVALAAAIAPNLALTLGGSLGTTLGIASASSLATLTAILEGALTGALSAAFSGNTHRILKDGFIGGWMAGFGIKMGEALGKTQALQGLDSAFKSNVTVAKFGKTSISQGVVTHALVSGMKAAIYVGFEGGKLSNSLLTAIGSSIGVGGVKEFGFMAHLNEKLTSVAISAAVTSVVTHSNFLGNAARIGLATLAQTAGSELGERIITAMTEPQPIAPNTESPVVASSENTPHVVVERASSAAPAASRQQQPVAGQNTENRPSVTQERSSEALTEPSRTAAHSSSARAEAFAELQQVGTRAARTNQAAQGKGGRGRVSSSYIVTKGFMSVMNALSGEAHAEENDPNGKVLLFSIDPNHKKFFAGRLLPEAQQESAAHQALGKGMAALRQTNTADRGIRAWPAGLDIQIGNDNPSWWSMASRAFKGDRSPDVLDWQQQNRQHMPTWAKGSDALNEAQEQWQLGTRFLGFLQTSEGMGQMAVALATGPFAPVVGAMGMDNVVTGLQTAWTGQHHSTSLYHVVNALGEKTGLYGPQGASYIEMALNIGSMVSSPNLRVSGNLLSQYKNSLQPRIKTPCPAEVYYGFSSLSKRQAAVLEKLPEVRSTVLIRKSDLNVSDLAALTAKTGDEFAMFTLGSRRLIVRGDQKYTYIEALIPKLTKEGWTWSAHTHPGITPASLIPSGKGGDRGLLELINQEQSLILNSTGKRSIFGVEAGMQRNLSINSIKARNNKP